MRVLGAQFTCNICGAESVFAPDGDWREASSCAGCGSSVRMRSMVHCLLWGLDTSERVLARLRPSSLVGIGLSDWSGYAEPLARAFDYTNTYYHQEPRLDVCAPGPEWKGRCDFMMSSDVFEHVPPPASRAFDGAFEVLKPGGLLVLTVPFADNDETIEHYPDLKDFAVLQHRGEYILVNRNVDGAFSLHADLVFHGGPGSTLEMRLFSRQGVIDALETAGFEDVRVHEDAVPEWGVFPPHHHGLPITARKPQARGRRWFRLP